MSLRELTQTLRNLVEADVSPQEHAKDFDKALQAFLSAAQNAINDYYAKEFPTQAAPVLGTQDGKRYVRVYKAAVGSPYKDAYCFIDKTNGDVLKAASWKAPAKHARGSIYNADHGLGGVTSHGAKYMK